jgi:hypothetical protein
VHIIHLTALKFHIAACLVYLPTGAAPRVIELEHGESDDLCRALTTDDEVKQYAGTLTINNRNRNGEEEQ